MGYKDKEKEKAYAREYYRKNRNSLLTKILHYKKSDQGRTTILQRAFGISSQHYNTLLDLQEHRCRLCGAPDRADGKSLAVDHDHETGKVRKLLCGKCNLTLGRHNDAPEWFERAALYLRVHGAKALA